MRCLLAVLAGLLVFSPAASAAESASTFNANPFKPTNGASPYECIAPAGADATSYFFSGEASPYKWSGLTWGGGSDPDDPPACPAGTLRVARWERFAIAGQSAYVMRGGGGSNAAEQFGNTGIRFGHVLYPSGLAKQTSVLTKYIPGRVGAAPSACLGKVYVNKPQHGTLPELSSLHTKPGQTHDDGGKWDNYGDQAGSGPRHYSYLLWTWPALPIRDGGGRNAGGGQIRAVIVRGQHIRACNVDYVDLPMYPEGAATAPVGAARMYYGRVTSGNVTLYGWFMHSWRMNGGKPQYFVTSR